MNNKTQNQQSQSDMINAFTVDVEGFIESNVESFEVPEGYIDKDRENYEIQKNTEAVLGLLDEVGVKGTFFFVGRIASDIPGLVKSAALAGHEIGCHNFEHRRIFNTEKEYFQKKLSDTKKILEDTSGKAVYGFRAPDFSITEESIWALDVLKQLGFVYDSSIYPFGLHDVYGIKGANSSINKLPNGLIEVPMSTVKVFGKRIPFGGGGYFRLYPVWLTRLFIDSVNKKGIPCISYIHPYEIGPEIPKIAELSPYRKFRHYYHCKEGGVRIRKLLRTIRFAPIIDVLKNNGMWKG